MASTDVRAFDLPQLYPAMQQCIREIRTSMQSERERDAMPQFTRTQVEQSTQFLKSAVRAMEDYVVSFKGSHLQLTDDAQLELKHKAVRESANRLLRLLSDRSSPFKGDSLRRGRLHLQERSQSSEIKAKLTSVRAFFQTFNGAEWVGAMFTNEYNAQHQLAVQIVEALLNPVRVKALPAVRNIPYGSVAETPGPKPAGLVELQAELTKAASWNCNVTERFRILHEVSTKMTLIIEKERQEFEAIAKEADLKKKALEDFASILSEVPDVMNTYLLVRIGDITRSDLLPLKRWITEDEATAAHSLLEEFRDAAVQEKSVRQVTARMGVISALSPSASFRSGASDTSSAWSFPSRADTA